MNDKQMNRLRMYRKVNGVYTNHKDVVARYVPIVKSYQTFEGSFSQIETIASEGALSGGSFESKEEMKESIGSLVSELAASAFVYAKDIGNTELAAVLDVSYSEIRYADDQTTLSLATAVLKELEGLLNPLEAYMITKSDLKELQQLIDAYKVSLQNTKSVDSVARTRQLAGLFSQASAHLSTHLDKLMQRIKRKEPVFFDTYTNARVIFDLGAGRKKEAVPEVFE